MSKANEKQVGGEHYKTISGLQHWDFVVNTDMPYLPAQVAKYLTRWRKKNGLQDLEKAKHFLEKFIDAERVRTAAVEYQTNELMDGMAMEKHDRDALIGLAVYHCNDPTVLEDTMLAIEHLIHKENIRLKDMAVATGASSK